MPTIVLIEPKIPQNTGNIARLCAATNTPLHLVGALGFSLDDKYLKRAGLDYWAHVSIKHYPCLNSYMIALAPKLSTCLSTKANQIYTQRRYTVDSTLVFGSETHGLSQKIRDSYPCVKIPMNNPSVRSLNLSTSVGIVLYEAIRQITC